MQEKVRGFEIAKGWENKEIHFQKIRFKTKLSIVLTFIFFLYDIYKFLFWRKNIWSM